MKLKHTKRSFTMEVKNACLSAVVLGQPEKLNRGGQKLLESCFGAWRSPLEVLKLKRGGVRKMLKIDLTLS
ncbi:hypothetical protein IMY05_013G0125200 [Salix suchowensis]|nr:hypothetical protein IMY05_013G0125200 [Salix suchowensis]